MRQEYTRLASAELEFDIPWIVDEMDNTLQKTYGGMPNMEFVIGPDGTLLASWDWANPNELKAFLEKKVGPSGISDEEWKKLSTRGGMMVSFRDNDEVPGTEVPRISLTPLKVESIAKEGEKRPPITLTAGTLPPKVTPGGLSRLYLTIQPDAENKAYFDNAEASVILLTDAKGIELQKDQILAGKRRGEGKDIYPHALGVMWALNEGAENMEFTATVQAKVGKGEEPTSDLTAKFRVSGPVPVIEISMDEILPAQLPPKEQLTSLQCVNSESEKVPFSVAASIYHDPANPGQGMIYLFLSVDAAGGYKWNALASAPEVILKPVSGIELEKNTIYAGEREILDEKGTRILAFWWKKTPEAKEIVLEATPTAWVCSDEQGWCRIFASTYRITGKF